MAPIGDSTSCLFTVRTASHIPATCDLRPASCHLHLYYDLHFQRLTTPNTHHPYSMMYAYISTPHDRGPLTSTFPFPMLFTFGFSGRYRLFPTIAAACDIVRVLLFHLV